METEFKLACAQFCFEKLHDTERRQENQICKFFIGEELEWLESLGYLFLQASVSGAGAGVGAAAATGPSMRRGVGSEVRNTHKENTFGVTDNTQYTYTSKLRATET